MKKVKLVILAVCVFQFFIQAQSQDREQTQQGTDNRSQNATENTTSNTQPDPADSVNEAGTSNATTGNTDQSASENGNGQANTDDGAEGTSDAQASNTPAVPQTTTSQSGSPAVLSGDNGASRDGTNNVQRASMNMAGSPAGNVDLAESNVNPDSEIKKRQREEQTSQDSIQVQSSQQRTMPGNAPGGSETDINDNSRRENDE